MAILVNYMAFDLCQLIDLHGFHYKDLQSLSVDTSKQNQRHNRETVSSCA